MLLAVRNILKAWLLLGGFVAAFTALGWWIGGLRLASVFVVCLLMAATVFWYGPRIVLASLGARELTVAEATLLHTTVERLAARGRRRPVPRLTSSQRPPPRAVSRARGLERVRRTQPGLTAALSFAELEGVIAHELAKIRQRDVVADLVVVLAGWLVEQAFPSRAAPASPSVQYPGADRRAWSRSCSRRAGVRSRPAGGAHLRVAARPCRLHPLEQVNELKEFSASPVTEPLYTVNPFEPIGIAAMFSTHPPIGERVSALRALDPSGGEKAARRLKKRRLGGPFNDKKPAASYSPGRLPSEYHRRWRA